jgi:solute carrier family 25 carnitine/acylcarnitine transporter 20/29
MSKNTESTEQKPKNAGQKSFLETTLAGGVGGACLVLVGHPLDTIKVRIQTMTVVPGVPPPYAGALDCFKKTVAREGFKGLYKGVTAPLMAVTPMYAFCFFGYEAGKRIFTTEKSFQELHLFSIAAAGATSAVFSTPIQAPQERVKCVLQVQESKKVYNGSLDCARALWKEGGHMSLFRGFWATMLRDGVASAFYFSSYEVISRKLSYDGKPPSVAGTIVAGGVAGMLNWLFAIPIDVLKSRLQVAPDGKYPNGIRSVFRDVMKNEGPATLFRGIGPIMLRAFPANAACFVGYETALKVINYFKNN